MMPGMDANLVSRMREMQSRGISEELARYMRLEYRSGGADLRAAIAVARRAPGRRVGAGLARAALRVLAKIPEVLAAAATPGGA